MIALKLPEVLLTIHTSLLVEMTGFSDSCGMKKTVKVCRYIAMDILTKRVLRSKFACLRAKFCSSTVDSLVLRSLTVALS